MRTVHLMAPLRIQSLDCPFRRRCCFASLNHPGLTLTRHRAVRIPAKVVTGFPSDLNIQTFHGTPHSVPVGYIRHNRLALIYP
jgi:hypothetical protein